MDNTCYTIKRQIDKMAKSINNLSPDTKVSLEFVLTALFPTVWHNIQEEMKKQYTQGYLEGLNEKNSNKGSS